ncbi:hypothetical protein BBF96_05990 [Anoxybacter fermentans]|uniref:Ferredoxin n=1 Tax=Anoxybacter fermentans TaxID=1323375 RepID=A0A3Q9HPT6_9FIRM|nr:4Fe-4S dicluster domain-containing protein [Anoxybacter fermentans]AZR72983.1 hypothetical protein BBF96_05990 [Anoxybacter fermentans]
MGKSIMGKLAKKLIANLTEPVKIEVCRGSLLGCPKGVVDPKDLEMEILDLMDQLDLINELKDCLSCENVSHPFLRISISGCVNGCSRPQIKDIGLEGVVSLRAVPEKCTHCGSCIKVCQEDAILLTEEGFSLNHERCLSCGDCARVCSSGALSIEKTGIRLLIGGRLGRHPHLGQPVAKFLTTKEALKKIRHFFEMVIREYHSGRNLEETLHYLEQNLFSASGR